MKSLEDIVRAMVKASTTEIASRLQIERSDALALLRELEELGKIQQVDGHWQVTAVTAPKLTDAEEPAPADEQEGFFESDYSGGGAIFIPTPTTLAREIRQVKSRLKSLERCHKALKEVYRHRHVLTDIQ